MIPTFGRAVIRRFGGNVSGMKKFAARDFEQVLKVRHVIPPSTCVANGLLVRHSVLRGPAPGAYEFYRSHHAVRAWSVARTGQAPVAFRLYYLSVQRRDEDSRPGHVSVTPPCVPAIPDQGTATGNSVPTTSSSSQDAGIWRSYV